MLETTGRPEGEALAVLPSGGFVLLDTTTHAELEAEGLARDVIRAVQDTRKAAGFDVSDRIRLSLPFAVGTRTAAAVASAFEVADVAGETLATEHVVTDADRRDPGTPAAGDGLEVRPGIRRIRRSSRRGPFANAGDFTVAVTRAAAKDGGIRMSDRAVAPTPCTPRCSSAQGERWVQPRVERTRRVLELLDDPQRTYRVVHVTGTNGKTSTSRIIESLLRAHGLRTGLFTSPHLERFTERIMIDGEPIADAAVADAWDEIAPFVDLVDAELAAAGDAPLTFFELLTVLAFVAFADAPIDVLVLEVGMGGAWDSTNTADGDVAVFAPIDIDHADRLGETIGEIAAVKAGIIKDGAAVVSAQQDPAADAVLRAAAAAARRDHRLRGRRVRPHRRSDSRSAGS